MCTGFSKITLVEFCRVVTGGELWYDGGGLRTLKVGVMSLPYLHSLPIKLNDLSLSSLHWRAILISKFVSKLVPQILTLQPGYLWVTMVVSIFAFSWNSSVILSALIREIKTISDLWEDWVLSDTRPQRWLGSLWNPSHIWNRHWYGWHIMWWLVLDWYLQFQRIVPLKH